MSDQQADQADKTYPSDFFAKLFGVTPRTIQELAKKGIIPKAGHNQYPIIATIKGYVSYLRQRKEYQQNTPIAEEKLRLARANADKVELQNLIAQGKVVPIELITDIVSKLAGSIAGQIDTIPAKMKRKHPHLDGQLIEDIKWQCVRAQNAIAELDEIVEDIIDEYTANITPD